MMTPPNSETNNIFVIILFAAVICISITIIAAIWISIFRRPKPDNLFVGEEPLVADSPDTDPLM